MNFKEWFLANEVRFKGLKRLFDKEYPDLPKYVKNDLYNNRVAFTMRKLIGRPAAIPTIAALGSDATHGSNDSMHGYLRTTGDSDVPSDAASRIFGAASFKDHIFDKTPIIINVSPLDFNDKSLTIMIERLFGFKPDDRIRDDNNRSKKQRSKLSEGGNEPIIVIKDDNNKYDLLEGWHRAMANLVFDGNDTIGAPPHHIIMLKSGQPIANKELNLWKKVPLKAFVGTMAA
tara:strand:+ start:6447 stop:7139 length:693 start_codon:yes stop_codon:yes gene_type:complete